MDINEKISNHIGKVSPNRVDGRQINSEKYVEDIGLRKQTFVFLCGIINFNTNIKEYLYEMEKLD